MALARHDEGFASIKQALVQGRQNIKYLSAQTGTGSLRLVSDAVVRNLDEPIPDALTQPKPEPKREGKQRPATASSVISRSSGSPGAALTGPASSPRGRDHGSNALDVRNGNSGSGPGTGRPLFAVPVAKPEKPKKLNRDDTAVLAWEIANKSSRRISAALARVGLEPPMPTIDFKGNVTVYKQRMPNVFEDLPRVSGGAHGLSSFTTDKTGPTEAVEVPKLRPASVFDVGDMGNPQIVQLAVNTRRQDPDGLVRLGPNGNAAPPPAETIISAEEMAAAAMRAKQKAKPSGLQGIVTVAASASSVASKEQQHRMERRRSSADPSAAAAASAPAPPPIVPPPLSDQLVDPGHIPLVATMAVAATHANRVYRVVGRLKTASSSSRKKGAEHAAGALVSTDPTGAGQDANRREDDNDDGADPEAMESIQQMAYASVGLVVPERYIPGKGVAALIQHQMVAATAAAAQVDLIATKRLAIEMAHLESKIGDGHNSLSSLLRPALASNGLVPQHLSTGSTAVLAASAAGASQAASNALGNGTNSSSSGRAVSAVVAVGGGGRGGRPSSASAYQSTSHQSAGGGGSASNGGGRPGTASTPSAASAAATASLGSLRLQKGQAGTAGSPPQLASSASASGVPRSGLAISSSAPSVPSASAPHPAPTPRSALASTTATPKAGGATAASQLAAGVNASSSANASAGVTASTVVRFAEGTKGGTGSVAASGRSGGFQQQLQLQPPFITTSGLGVSLGPFSAATAGSARSTGDYFMGQTPKMSPFTSPTAQPFASSSMTSAMGSPLGGAGSSVGLQSPASSSIASPSSMFSPSQQQKQLQPQQKQQQQLQQQQQQEQQRHRHDNQTDSEDDEYDEEQEAERIAEQQLRDPKLNPFKLPRSEFERVQALPRPGSAAAAAMTITMNAAAVAAGGGSGAGADAVVARVTPSGLVRIGAAGAHAGKQSSASGHQSSTAGVAGGGGSGGGGGGARRGSNGNGWTAASSSASNSSSALVLDPSQAASLAELQHIAHPSVSTALAAMFRHTDIRRKHFAEVRERLQGIRRNAAQNACDAVAAYTYRLGQVRSHRYNAVADVMDLKGQQQQHEDQTKEHSPGDPNSNRHNGTQHPQSMINAGSADESLTAMRLVTAREGYLDEADNLDLLQTAVTATSEGKPAGISGIERSFLVHLRAAALSSSPINKAFVWKLLENAHVGALSCSASQLLLPEDIQHALEQQALMGKAINRSKSGGGSGGDGGVGAGWEVEPPPDSALEAFLDKKKQSRSKVLGVSALGVNAKQRRRSSISSNFALGMLNGCQSLGFMAKPSSAATAAGSGSGTNSAVGSRRPSIHGPASAIASRRNSFANAGAGGAGCDVPSGAAAALGSSAKSMQALQQLPSSSSLPSPPVALPWHSQRQQHQYQVSQVGAHAHLRPSSASVTSLPLPTSSSSPLPSSTASSTPLFKLDLRLVPASPIRVTQQNSNTGSGNGGSGSNLGHNSAHAFNSAAAGNTKAFDDQLLAGIEFTAVDSGRLGYHGASAGSASVGGDVGVVAAATASSSSSPGHFSSPIIRRLSLSIQQANASAFLQSQSLQQQQQQARPGSATATASSSSAWARNTGRPASAAPGTSNHGTALSYTATERNGAGGGGGGSAGIGTRPASAKAVVVFGQHASALGHSSTAPAGPGSARAPGSLASGTASLPSPEATPSPSSSSSASAAASSSAAATAAGTGSASMEPLATIPSKLLTAAEKAARVARRTWPVVLEAPISLFLAYVDISDAEYWSWLEDHDLRPPNPESRAAYGALQRSRALRELSLTAEGVASLTSVGVTSGGQLKVT